jgi:hypothetical protein
METQVLKSNFKLPQEIVIVKYIHRSKGMAANVDKNHVISGGLMSKAVRKFCAPLMRNGSVANILSSDEKEYLENETGLKLSVYGEFWNNFRVPLHKEDANNRFDLSDPMDYISYKILNSLNSEISPTWSARNSKQTYQFAICREDEEMLEIKGKYDSKKEAFKLYGKIEDDKDKLLGILKLITNKPISKESKLDWLQHKVEEFIDVTPAQFVAVVNDKSLYTKLLINLGIDKEVIIKRGNKYSTIDGLDLCNSGEIATFENAVLYLDNVKNQEIRSLIEAKINKVK